MLTAIEIARIAAIQAEIANGVYTNGAELTALLAKQVASANPVTVLTKEAFMASTLGSANGAEVIPFALYSLVSGADGRPTLIGGTYGVDGSIERELYKPLDGIAADAQPDYIKKGSKRAVYFVAKNNQSALEFRLSASALQAAVKGSATADFNANGMELGQSVTENAGGYKIPKVTLA